MPFFARPDLSNEQFKQLSGSTLTLSGTTRIAKIGGLEFIDEYGTPIPVIITGASDSKVLTYYDGNLILMSGGTGSTGLLYPYVESATTTVGGLCAGQNLYGVQVVDILHDILVPTLNPILCSPYSVFTLTPYTSTCEVGTSINFTGSLTFNPGSISPAYCGGPSIRSGLATAYSFSYWNGAPPVTGISSSCNFGTYSIGAGNNIAYGCVYYGAGLQPLNSAGLPYLSACTAGVTCCTCSPLACMSRTIVGLFPYFWGLCNCPGAPGANRPSGTSAMVLSGTKVVACSAADITIPFNAVSGNDYLWFAVPSCVADKTCWCCNTSFFGAIGGGVCVGGNLFPSPISGGTCNVSVTSISPPWTCNYDIYISNKQSIAATLKMGYA